MMAWNVVNSVSVISLMAWGAMLSYNAAGRARQVEAKTAAIAELKKQPRIGIY
jgi:hypothetical protein